MINDAVFEGNYKYFVPEQTRALRQAYCANCATDVYRQSDSSSMKLKPNAKQGDIMCPDCRHALFWKFVRVNK